MSYRFAPSEPQPQARYERKVNVNVVQGAIGSERLLQIDSASESSLLSSAMSWPSWSCQCSSGAETISFLARL